MLLSTDDQSKIHLAPDDVRIIIYQQASIVGERKRVESQL